MITQSDFLNEASGFIGYLRQLIGGQEVMHNYEIDRREGDWITNGNAGQQSWRCRNLQQAFESYCWAGHNGTATNQSLTRLGKKATDALANNSQQEFLYACMDIMAWGGVIRQNAYTLLSKYRDNTLIRSVQLALQQIQSPEPNLDCFRKKQCIMTSGYSKIYALLAPEAVIYDSRVAAGLGLLLRHYYEHYQDIPECLRFHIPQGQGDRNNRRVYFGNRALPSLPTSNYPEYARWNIKLNWLLAEAVRDARFAGQNDVRSRMRAMEQALFMLGYKTN